MNYQKAPTMNYFACIFGLNAIVVVFNIIGLLGLLKNDPLMLVIGGCGLVFFFFALYYAFKTAIQHEGFKDMVLVSNIQQKYAFTEVQISETSLEERANYGVKVLVSEGAGQLAFFVNTKSETNEPFLFEVSDGEKTPIESYYLRDHDMSA